ncbi:MULTISPECIES: glycosyltransferase family 4 protein [Ramlibacter]|uniref:Glycosyltransferase n=1 Tax=Ramlibacter pinisoli TaxID=2682844 RepID=A0A6N8IRM0_9BURK|nr:MULTISPECIES: glycosyltransferase family 4 protein [Ramlibacter]MBA2964518.1 glycosyltransferase family 4 protein [Ramlibacter sp. CGMCC 1.13660]MVQ29484.1 glycosyltransferase [Ramlibacter pinisoli]
MTRPAGVPAVLSTTPLETAGGGFPAPAAPLPHEASRVDGRYIYIAGPCTPMGGGMFKVAEYLVQAQPQDTPGGPVLRLLETRGGGSALWSPFWLARAVAALARGRLSGRLAGVHVNVAERLSLVRKGVVLGACRVLGLRSVLHLHAAQLAQNYAGLPAPGKALVRWLFSLPASCVVLGQAAADFVTRELRVPPEKVEIVINGVPEPLAVRRTVPAVSPHVVFLGNLSERKGVPELLQALTQPALVGVPLRLSLAGGGHVEHYSNLAQQLGVADRVTFHGWAGREQVSRLLADADVMVLPSHDEGLPLAILEALAHGVAVLCTPVGEIPNVLANGRDARFVAPGDPASIARGLAQLLADRDMRERLGRNGRALYEAQFSVQRFGMAIAHVHQREFGLSAPPARADGS